MAQNNPFGILNAGAAFTKRRTFFSFYFADDAQRAGQVRNMGMVDGDAPVSDNDWEQVKRGGDAAIQRWIDGQLSGKSCTVVLIGTNTYSRKWVKYEIEKSWASGKGLMGIHIHGLKTMQGQTAAKGPNPFQYVVVGGSTLANRVPVYDPTGWDSKQIYENIKTNLAAWVEDAISNRAKYP